MDRAPIIDIAPFLAGDPAGRDAVVRALRSAAEEIGFFAVTGHGVAPEIIDELYAQARVFFSQTEAQKSLVAPPTATYPRGWKAVGFEALSFGNASATPTDLKEYYHFGRADWPTNDAYYMGAEGQQYFHRNIWPKEPAGFAIAADAYYQAMERLAADLCRIAALALDLDEFFFQNKIDRHITATRINYYPRQDNPPEEGQLRAGAHTDFGMLTILSGENAPGGLQVRTRAGAWVDVPTDPHRFVCNIGDLLMRWTNDRWVSNVHRVLNPPREIARSTSRISIGFFQNPNYDALVECIPSCLRPGESPRYAPVRSGEFRDYKYYVTRDQKAS